MPVGFLAHGSAACAGRQEQQSGSCRDGLVQQDTAHFAHVRAQGTRSSGAHPGLVRQVGGVVLVVVLLCSLLRGAKLQECKARACSPSPSRARLALTQPARGKSCA